MSRHATVAFWMSYGPKFPRVTGALSRSIHGGEKKYLRTPGFYFLALLNLRHHRHHSVSTSVERPPLPARCAVVPFLLDHFGCFVSVAYASTRPSLLPLVSPLHSVPLLLLLLVLIGSTTARRSWWRAVSRGRGRGKEGFTTSLGHRSEDGAAVVITNDVLKKGFWI